MPTGPVATEKDEGRHPVGRDPREVLEHVRTRHAVLHGRGGDEEHREDLSRVKQSTRQMLSSASCSGVRNR